MTKETLLQRIERLRENQIEREIIELVGPREWRQAFGWLEAEKTREERLQYMVDKNLALAQYHNELANLILDLMERIEDGAIPMPDETGRTE